ncbi:MAG: hypothetical protein ACJAYK_001065 [Crocinitomicaceae bacterium]
MSHRGQLTPIELVNVLYKEKPIRNNKVNQFAQFSVLSILLFVSMLSHSNNVFLDHGEAVSRAMSAFYMFGASQGETRYKVEYEKELNIAEQALLKLQKKEAPFAARLMKNWAQLRPRLVYNFDEYSGYYVAGQTQGEFRGYLNRYYTEYSNKQYQYSNKAERLQHTQVLIEIVLARFFDLASSPIPDNQGFGAIQPVIDVKVIVKMIKKNLQVLEKYSVGNVYHSDIKNVVTKWNFIESSVLNSQKQPVILLIYYNKKRIIHLLDKSKQKLIAKK